MAPEVDIPDATAITPWLYVGAQDCIALERRELLIEKGVTHVVSVQKVPPPWLVGKAGTLPPLPFEYLHVKVEDTLTANIASHFENIDAFLASAKAASGRAVVHCAFGQSRSVTAAVAHLMISEKRSLGEALEAVRSRRPKACPNKSFLAALVRLELELFENTPSDLRRFPSLPKQWAFVEWPCPLRQNTRFVSCHGRVMRVRNVSKRPNVSVVAGFLTPEETDAIVRTAAPDLHPSLVVQHDVPRGADDDEEKNAARDAEHAERDATARDDEGDARTPSTSKKKGRARYPPVARPGTAASPRRTRPCAARSSARRTSRRCCLRTRSQRRWCGTCQARSTTSTTTSSTVRRRVSQRRRASAGSGSRPFWPTSANRIRAAARRSRACTWASTRGKATHCCGGTSPRTGGRM